MSEKLSEAQLKYAVPWLIMGRQQDVVLERKYAEEKKIAVIWCKYERIWSNLCALIGLAVDV